MVNVNVRDLDGLVGQKLRKKLEQIYRPLVEATAQLVKHEPQGAVYLGDLCSIFPSGKYYTPWANGNVSPCPECGGTGCGYCGGLGSREAYLDEVVWEILDDLGWQLGVSVDLHEGCPTDVIAVSLDDERVRIPF